MEDYYRTLGISPSSSHEEVRRAYRVLARRYHPDVNPGNTSEDVFKRVAEAYAVLSDADRRRSYDDEVRLIRARSKGAGADAYSQAGRSRKSPPQQAGDTNRQKTAEQQTSLAARSAPNPIQAIFRALSALLPQQRPKIVMVDVLISVPEAISGARKQITIERHGEPRRIPVRIPPGAHPGYAIHLQSKKDRSQSVVAIVQHAPHSFLSLQARGLVAEIPLTIMEALAGATIVVPTLDEPVTVKIPPGTQSGYEVKLPGRGAPRREDPLSRGDLYLKFHVRVPDAPAAMHVAAELERHYGSNVRRHLGNVLLSS
jgi:curved DNA-binding protein